MKPDNDCASATSLIDGLAAQRLEHEIDEWDCPPHDLTPDQFEPPQTPIAAKAGIRMGSMPNLEAADIRVTVDGGEFYSFVRALKRGYGARSLGEVAMRVSAGTLTIESARSGCVLPGNETTPVVAHVSPGNFCRLASLAADAHATGPLEIVFRPSLGEIGFPHSGTKARFD